MTEQLNPDQIKQFLEWEQASRDTIDVKRVYIDLAGDIVTGILLSQIIYWFLPSRGESKLRVEREGRVWLAKLRTDWWNECRISPKQFDRSITVLKEKGLVETKLYHFKGSVPTLHVCLNLAAVVEGVKCILPKGENGLSPKVEMHLDQRGKCYTETTDIDYLTEIRDVEMEENLKALLFAVAQLPYWGSGELQADTRWLIEFTADYPDLSEQVIRECRDFWDGRRARNKGIWKNRLRNWITKGREIKASSRKVIPGQPAKYAVLDQTDPARFTQGRYGHLFQKDPP